MNNYLEFIINKNLFMKAMLGTAIMSQPFVVTVFCMFSID